MAKKKDIVLVAITSVFLCGFLLWSILKPADARSVSERRPLATFPKPSMQAVFSGKFMEDFEKYTLDQFPLREGFRRVKAIAALYVLGQRDNNQVYISGGFASKLDYPLNMESVEYAASRFQFVYDRYLKDMQGKIYLSIIPDKNYFLARENGYPALDYPALVKGIAERMDYARYIDIFQQLSLSSYYRTDSHWRQEEIIKAARHLALEMGVNLSAEYTIKTSEVPFYGVYYGQAALPLPPDQLQYLQAAFLENVRAYDYETSAHIPIYDLDAAGGDDPYEMFLCGPKSLIEIENPAASTGRELIIFRDSFGSSIAPLLAEGYEKITLVDIRYISPAMLDKFISFKGQDVLFLYSSSVLNNSSTIK